MIRKISESITKKLIKGQIEINNLTKGLSHILIKSHLSGKINIPQILNGSFRLANNMYFVYMDIHIYLPLINKYKKERRPTFYRENRC